MQCSTVNKKNHLFPQSQAITVNTGDKPHSQISRTLSFEAQILKKSFF